MSIDISLRTARAERFSQSLSGNVREIAIAVKLYNPIWRPYYFCGVNGLCNLTPYAIQLCNGLQKGLDELNANPELYRNERGLHDYFALRDFTQKYLDACKKWPHALVVMT